MSCTALYFFVVVIRGEMFDVRCMMDDVGCKMLDVLYYNPRGINRKGDRVGAKNFFIDSTLEEIIYICRLK